MEPNHGNPRRNLLICLFLAAATFAAYSRVLQNDFIKLDDHHYILENPHVLTGLTWDNLKWAFQSGYASNWHPLTWISHMLDVQWFGLNPKWHHLVNLLFHIANTILLFVVLQFMTKKAWPSAFVAALFGLHPLHVESVAWVAERKDVLSTFFLMLTLWAYAIYADKVSSPKSKVQGPESKKCWGFYVLALVLFALGLMSKPMLVTTPFLLLLLDVWPLRRIETMPLKWKALLPLVIEKIPLFILCALSSAMTFYAQDKGHSVSINLPISARLANAIASYVKYLGKTVWPTDLAVFYPHPELHYPVSAQWPDWQIAVAAIALLTISFLSIKRWKEPWLATGWFWFLGTLVPTIGIVQVGGQAMADRYTYIPLIGVFIMMTWKAVEAFEGEKTRKTLLQISGIAIVGACALATNRQASFWRTNRTLFEHAMKVTRDNPVAYFQVAQDYGREGHFEQVVPLLRQAIAADPNFADAHNNLGFALQQLGRFDEAEGEFLAALSVQPWHALAHYNLANLFLSLGNRDQAIEHFQAAVESEPDFVDALVKFGQALVLTGRSQEAERYLEKAINLNPDHVEARLALAGALAKTGDHEKATEQIRRIARNATATPEAHSSLAEMFWKCGHPNEAIQHYRTSIELNTNYLPAIGGLGRTLAATGRFTEAEPLFTRWTHISPTNAQAHLELGKTLRLLGDETRATTSFSNALNLDPSLPEKTMATAKELFERGELEPAKAMFTTAAWLQPTNAEAHSNLGVIMAQQNRLSEALSEFQKLLQLRPDAQSYYYLGLTETLLGHAAEAIMNYEQAVRLRPDWDLALNNLAWLLATTPKANLRNGAKAVQLAEHLCSLKDKTEAQYWGTLAAAYAEAGRFQTATQAAEKAYDLAQQQGLTALAEKNLELLKLYRSEKPYHE